MLRRKRGIFIFHKNFARARQTERQENTILCGMYVEKAIRIHKYTHDKVLQVYLLGYRHDVEECVIFNFKISIANIVDFSCFCGVWQGYHIER